jgi:hypothetical protein
MSEGHPQTPGKRVSPLCTPQIQWPVKTARQRPREAKPVNGAVVIGDPDAGLPAPRAATTVVGAGRVAERGGQMLL